ncbi:MAG: hypothetical protein Q9168_005372 [Polycauliona sp. 1 TL-2023]
MVDGRWATRTLDIHHILARNKEEKHKAANRDLADQGRPRVGILTRTLVKSPVVRSIIPARVRHKNKNDVVFVYNDAIVIKEVLGGEMIGKRLLTPSPAMVSGQEIAAKPVTVDVFRDISLEDVAEKRDFDAPILAARILGLPRLSVPGKSRSPATGSYGSQSPSEIKPDLLHDNEVPPQILVLTLASRKLLFLFAFHDVHEQVHFLSKIWPLPARAEENEELGVHLTVDPK